jgi:UDP-N-acetylglucosamine 2-epimerase
MNLRMMLVAGARPNFMKVAPIWHEVRKREGVSAVVVHTGQHYDANMSDVFFVELGLPKPDEFLGVGSGTHAEQTAKVMLAFEPVLQKYEPDVVVVVGDVNSTLACALVAVKMGIRVAHVEAGCAAEIEICRRRLTELPPMPFRTICLPLARTRMQTCYVRGFRQSEYSLWEM